MKGITGKILEIDLSAKKLNKIEIEEGVYKKYMGGSGLAAKIFLDRELYKVEPLSESNQLMFFVGPLTGTTLPGTSRFEVCCKSPLTGIWAEASCGAHFGKEIKCAGYDGIIIKGRADYPVYIEIIDDKVEIKDAKHLWGKDTYEIDEHFANLDKKWQVATIGVGGENQVLFAGITTDKGDHAARCGVGAVMGSKKLKAIAIKGTKKVNISDTESYDKLRKKLNEKIKMDPLCMALHKYGTNSGMQLGAQVGDVPTKNWRVALWEKGVEKIDGAAITQNVLRKTKSCFACPVSCKRVVEVSDNKFKVEEGPGPEYESAAALGSLLLNDNLSALCKANELCNKFGIDTISTGSVIAFAFECYENNLLIKSDIDGLDLRFGNIDTMLTLIEKIAQREGLGNILADGVRRAAQKIGKGADKFALEIRGLEQPMHDPRAYHGLALTYATSPRGACHTNDMNLMIEMGISKYPELSIKGGYSSLSSERKADVTVKSQNLGMIYSSAVMCYFVVSMLSADDIRDMIKVVCGWDISLDEMMKIGERIWHLKRGINTLCNPNDYTLDKLPERIKNPYLEGSLPGIEKIVAKLTSTKPPKHPRIRKKMNDFTYNVLFPRMKYIVRFINKINILGRRRLIKNPFLVVPDMDKMLKEFYELRGLTNEGRVKKGKLKDLGLDDLLNKV